MITKEMTEKLVWPLLTRVDAWPYGSAEPTLPDPTTEQITAASYAVGITGIQNKTTNAARIYGAAGRTLWVGYITGTDAVLTATSNSGAQDNLIEVSINGEAFVSASHVGSAYTLFSGQPHATRFVAIRYGAAFGTGPYIASSGNVLSVTGQPPSVVPFHNWAQLRDGNELTAYSALLQAAPANYLPAYVLPQSASTNGSNVASIKIRGAFNNLAIVGNTVAVYVSKNGGPATKYSRSDALTSTLYPFLIEGLDGDLATYYIWNAGNPSTTTCQFSVSGDAELEDCGIKRRLDQYGDSITDGTSGGNTRGDVDTMQAAAAIGFVGSTNGVGGLTTSGLNTNLDTWLPGRQVSSDDVAVLAIGRNDAGAGLPQATYESCINKLLTKGYGKILCRGILPEGAQTWATPNAVIQAAVVAVDSPNVIFIDTSSWSGIQTSDGVHPTVDGYVTIAGYAVPAYTTALGL